MPGNKFRTRDLSLAVTLAIGTGKRNIEYDEAWVPTTYIAQNNKNIYRAK